MANTPAPWTTAMLNHLADGRWYELDQVLTIGMRAVPPGRAIQERERERAHRNRDEGPRRERTPDQAITIGARHLARNSLTKLISRDRVERNGQLVRRTP